MGFEFKPQVLQVLFSSFLGLFPQSCDPHLRIAEPHVSPALKPAVAMVSPAFTFTVPFRTASSKAKGMDAVLVLP